MSTATQPTKKKFRFKLVRGRHSQMEQDPSGGPPVQKFYAATVYGKEGEVHHPKDEDPSDFSGDIVESDLELDKMFNAKGGQEPKFQRIHEESQHAPAAQANAPPAAVMNDGLDAMTVKQLQELAAGEEIDLPKGADKQRMIDTIRQSR
jgi:hypothetical protein